ncbi:hypothetical protein B0H11DRAFT_2036095, partial [Mycena galericulata]
TPTTPFLSSVRPSALLPSFPLCSAATTHLSSYSKPSSQYLKHSSCQVVRFVHAATRSSKTSNLGRGNHHQAFCDPAEEPSSNLLPSVPFKSYIPRNSAKSKLCAARELDDGKWCRGMGGLYIFARGTLLLGLLVRIVLSM